MRKCLRVKEDWQDPYDRTDGQKKFYGVRKDIQFPISIADELKKAASAAGVSQSRYVVQAVAEKLGIDLDT